MKVNDIPNQLSSEGEMKGRNIGIMLAGIWFVMTGLIPLFSISMANLNLIMAVLAVATGVVLLLGK